MITNTEIEKRGNQHPNHIVDFKHENDKIFFTTQNGVILEITILRDSAIRFRYATEHVFEPDFSYAISDDVSLGYNNLTVKEEIPEYVITTSKVKIFVNKTDLKRPCLNMSWLPKALVIMKPGKKLFIILETL